MVVNLLFRYRKLRFSEPDFLYPPTLADTKGFRLEKVLIQYNDYNS